MKQSFMSPYFLGSYGENNEILEQILLELIRDHVYWRRNFHPEDPPPISTLASHDPDYVMFVARAKRELHLLSASLKRSVPFFNPRYIGHMASDSFLPGLIAQMVTTLYNPNNVVAEAAPVTVDMEIKVGLQLARMFGFHADPEARPCAFGHLTSGGTVANFEALNVHRSVRCYPVALKRAAEQVGLKLALEGRTEDIRTLSDWELMTLTPAQSIALRAGAAAAMSGQGKREISAFADRVGGARIETMGMADFQASLDDCRPPRVMVPVTAHYSWAKAMKVLGLGEAQLVRIPERNMRMDPDALEHALLEAREAHAPVMTVVGVLGTTEFGTIDPIDRIVALRERYAGEGFGFGIHVDAAWGGYITSLFRAEDGALMPYKTVRGKFRYFPSEPVYDSFAALANVDSVTVDPHKLGYLPFGTGAVVYRDSESVGFIAQDAPYVFDITEDGGTEDYFSRFRNLGRFIFEGSKPGASAAAAYVTHRILPLDVNNFGRLPEQTIQSTEYFYDRIAKTAESLEGKARLIVPFDPDTNLICLAVNPEGNTSLAKMNAFSREVFGHIKVDPGQPVQNKKFFGSQTSLDLRQLSETEWQDILTKLGIDPATAVHDIDDPKIQAGSMFVLRHTLMNPWLRDELNDINYVDRYCAYLEDVIERELKRL